MYISGALILIAIGAILLWAVNVSTAVIDIRLAGLIVLIVGIIGLIVAMIFWFTHRGPGRPVSPTDDRFEPY
jgi:hypothetical protein